MNLNHEKLNKMKAFEIIVNEKTYQVSGVRIHGHAGSYTLEAVINGEDYKGFTHNASLMDDYNEDESYFEDDNSGHWYSSAKEVDETIAEMVIEQNSL